LHVAKFGSGLSQALYTEVYVPSTYNTGTAIALDLPIYSAGNTGTMHMVAVATLINPGISIGTSSILRTTTNAAISLTTTVSNIRQIVTLDLSGTNGTIGSSVVYPNATIAIQLYRTTDTSTDDVCVLRKQCELRMT
jgi:hypothetical protein